MGIIEIKEGGKGRKWGNRQKERKGYSGLVFTGVELSDS